MTTSKEEVGHLVGKITLDGKEVEGVWEVAVYFKPLAKPGKPLAYLIGYATRKE